MRLGRRILAMTLVVLSSPWAWADSASTTSLCWVPFQNTVPSKARSPGDLALDELYSAINLQVRFDQRHAMSLRRGQGYLQIGYLTQEDPRFLGALRQAVAAGRIDQIDIGNIIGPKVYNWIVRTVEHVPRDHVMTLTGRLNAGEVAESKLAQLEKTKADNFSYWDEPGERWTESNIEQYERAVEKLGVREACRKFYRTTDLQKCGALKFILRSNTFDSIVWEKGRS